MATRQTFGEPISMVPYGQVIWCYICSPGKKIGQRASAILCTTYSEEGRCAAHAHIPDTELPKIGQAVLTNCDPGDEIDS